MKVKLSYFIDWKLILIHLIRVRIDLLGRSPTQSNWGFLKVLAFSYVKFFLLVNCSYSRLKGFQGHLEKGSLVWVFWYLRFNLGKLLLAQIFSKITHKNFHNFLFSEKWSFEGLFNFGVYQFWYGSLMAVAELVLPRTL